MIFILIFSYYASNIDNFLKSEYGLNYLQEYKDGSGNVNLITEETKDIRKVVINKATLAGNVTFAIREFGRGIDFVCRDKCV